MINFHIPFVYRKCKLIRNVSIHSCVYRFEANKKEERIKITLTRVVIKGRDCHTSLNSNTDRLHCYGNTSATLRIYEVPWRDVPPVPRDCICSRESVILPFTYVSTSQIVELRFDIKDMSSTDDFESLYFEGSWKIIRMPVCSRKQRKSAASGAITFYALSKSTEEVTKYSHSDIKPVLNDQTSFQTYFKIKTIVKIFYYLL